jgi:4a-hydroxytetrahydrobiopterin dehydratase
MDTLSDKEIDAALRGLPGWDAEGPALVRSVRLASFAEAIAFVARVAEVAEEKQHHPDIDVRYDKVTLRLSSHDAGGVTERDVALAEAITQLI